MASPWTRASCRRFWKSASTSSRLSQLIQLSGTPEGRDSRCFSTSDSDSPDSKPVGARSSNASAASADSRCTVVRSFRAPSICSRVRCSRVESNNELARSRHTKSPPRSTGPQALEISIEVLNICARWPAVSELPSSAGGGACDRACNCEMRPMTSWRLRPRGCRISFMALARAESSERRLTS